MDVAARARRLRLLLFDVDGVLTDASVVIGAGGQETKTFSIRDGAALVWARQIGLEVGLLSGRPSPATTARAAELGDAQWRQLLAEHHARVRRQLARFRGVELDTAGDGFFVRFDGPARGIRCAVAIRDALRDLGLEVRLGLHTGECEALDGKVTGIAVSIGARVSGLAAAGEVLVSQTVKDLVAGSGITFADRGVQQLKGVPGEWRLYSVAAV